MTIRCIIDMKFTVHEFIKFMNCHVNMAFPVTYVSKVVSTGFTTQSCYMKVNHFLKFVFILRIDTSGLRPYQNKGNISWSK